MSLRLNMLQMARLSAKLLGESAALVESFLRGQIDAGGGFRNRAGESDLYYTVFGLESLIALRAEPPAGDVARYLRTFAGGEGLDFVHLACLARCWAGVQRGLDATTGQSILAGIEAFRTPEGGYNQAPGSPRGTAYAAMLALGAYQDMGVPVPEPDRLAASVMSLRAADGGFGNMAGASAGLTTATAAAVAILRQLDHPISPSPAPWLLERLHPGGGFFALPGAPIPDLLSTATALHALTTLQTPHDARREPCLDYLDSLWTNRGGFYGHWSDDAIDTEYTYYALLSLGHLAV